MVSYPPLPNRDHHPPDSGRRPSRIRKETFPLTTVLPKLQGSSLSSKLNAAGAALPLVNTTQDSSAPLVVDSSIGAQVQPDHQELVP